MCTASVSVFLANAEGQLLHRELSLGMVVYLECPYICAAETRSVTRTHHQTQGTMQNHFQKLGHAVTKAKFSRSNVFRFSASMPSTPS